MNMPVIDDPELERVCMLNCEARHGAACEMNIGSLDQCRGQCLIADEISYGYCLPEQRAQQSCLASGGYTCVSGYPQPKSTCIAEAQALAQCNQLTPCRMFCEQAAGNCAPSGEQCVEDCRDKQTGFEDATCGIYYGQLLNCWSRGLECDGDVPAVGDCGPQLAQVADCIERRNEPCDGFCWAAEQLGCGSSECVSECEANIDVSICGSYYRSVLSCAFGSRELNVICEDGNAVPDPTACASQIEQFESCE
jgi:hypothetical protein